MSQNKSISVLIPVYNAEKYLGEAIESVLRQTIKPLEIIILNDGSTDESLEIAKEFEPRVSVYSQPNKGLSGARNAALKRATGSIIAFLDADDLWPSNHLEILFSALQEENDPDIVFGHVEQFLSEEVRKTSNAIPDDQRILGGYVAGASLIKKKVFDEVGLFDEKLTLAEYIDWFARVKDAGISYKILDEVVLKRRIHTTNIGIRKRSHIHDYTKVLMASIKRKRETMNSGK